MSDDIVIGHIPTYAQKPGLPTHIYVNLRDLTPELQELVKAAIQWNSVFTHGEQDQYRLELAAENFAHSVKLDDTWKKVQEMNDINAIKIGASRNCQLLFESKGEDSCYITIKHWCSFRKKDYAYTKVKS